MNLNFLPSRAILSVSVFALAIFLVLPAEFEPNLFNGLPFNTKVEALCVLFLMPGLFFVNVDFLKKNSTALCLLTLCLIKSAMVWLFSPIGIDLRLAASNQLYMTRQFQPTYESVWYSENGFVRATRPLNVREDFPMSWLIAIPSNRDKYEPVVEFSTWLHLYENTNLAIVGGAASQAESRAKILNVSSNEIRDLNISKADLATSSNPVFWSELQAGVYKIDGIIHYKGTSWKLDFLSQNGGETKSLLKSRQLTLSKISPPSNEIIRSLAPSIPSIGFLVFLFAWIVSSFRLNPYLMTFAAAYGFGAGLVCKSFGGEPQSLAWYVLGGFAGLNLAVSRFRFKFMELPIRYIPALIGSALLCFFARRWWGDIDRVSFFDPQDDWGTYQRMANQIFVEGVPFFSGAEEMATYQLLYRYVAGALHVVFGSSCFAQRMVDIWCIVGVSLICRHVIKDLINNKKLGDLSAVCFVVLALRSNFAMYLGSGLQEFVAAFLQMATLLFILRFAQSQSKFMLVGASLLGMLAFWARMDHLIVIGCFSLFMFWDNACEKPLFTLLKRNFAGFLIYNCALLLSIFCVAWRNHTFGGVWVLNNPNNLRYLSLNTFQDRIGNIRNFIWSYYPQDVPSLLSAFSLTALMVALSKIISSIFMTVKPNTKIFTAVPLPLAITVIFGILPYLFVKTVGYPPRFYVHMLPLYVLTIFCFLSGFRKRKADLT